ncbi:hypothetical protein J4218_04870 [Candidatus Pacearchaeota archaeon]|nr:hypothetical protein [Candidatus Pacearchaeota archaeon]
MANNVTLVKAYENGLAYLESKGRSYVRDVTSTPKRIREAAPQDFHPMFAHLTRPNILLNEGLEFQDFDVANNALEASSLMLYLARESLRGIISDQGIKNLQRKINEMDLSYFCGIKPFEEFKPALHLEPEDLTKFLKSLTKS